ncbi:MAG: ABC transporter substrate-binding protein [Lachnospiraceae bacterium]|nr:ABC transporter substrate-binding protein [Lachnospiraceae bacterium]
MKFSNKIAKKVMVAGLLAIVLAVSGCTSKNDVAAESLDSKSQPAEEIKDEIKKPVLHLEGEDVGLPNPFKHSKRGPGIGRMQLLYDSLLEKDENGNIPWLAESWKTSEDGTIYTFSMQKSALWHDGTPLTANDVEFTLSYYKEHPPVDNGLLSNGEYIVTSTKVIDDYTIEVTTNHFDNTYLTKIGGVRILPKHIWENVSDPAEYTAEGATIGSGPYMLEAYDAAHGTYRYVAFEKYWGLTPAASAIEWIPVSESVLAFENNEIDLINATADVLPRYESDSTYTIKSAPSYHSYRLMMNMEAVASLQDKNLRKAIAYGINREELVDKIARGEATISSMGYVPTYSKWYNPNVEKYEYNESKALELLGGKNYSFKLLTDNTAQGTKTAELIKLSLEKVGINVTVESVEAKTRDNAVNTGEYELLLINSGGMGGDPDYLSAVYGKTAKTIIGYSNNEVYELIAKQSVEQSEDAREEMIFDLQEKIADDVPMIMLFGATDNFVYRSETYDGWMFRYDHSKCDHNKLSYLIRK